MKKNISLFAILLLALACNEQVKQNAAETSPETTEDSTVTKSAEEIAEELNQQGYKTFLIPEGDTTYLMQQYFIVFLKAGENRGQDSLTTARLQEQHLAHLNRMATGGYSSLTGPFGDDGEIRGAVIYNTATLEEADSLAKLDPMVKAGRLKVEVHPWWIAKGGKLP